MTLEKNIIQYIKNLVPKNLGLEKCKCYSRIEGAYSGESNKVYFFYFGEHPFVLKINGIRGKDPIFFEREFHKLKSLEEYSIAPRAHIYDKHSLENPAIILDMLQGTTLNEGDISKHLDGILDTLNDMVEIPSNDLRQKRGFKRNVINCWDYVNMFPSYAAIQLGEYLTRFGNDEIYKLVKKASDNAMKKIDNQREIFEDSEIGLVHTGLHPENIVYTPKGKIRFIDWEHSSVGDRAFEISSLLRSNKLNLKDVKKVFEVYRGQTGRFQERVNLYTDLFKIHEVLWHAIRFDKTIKGEINLSNIKTYEYYYDLFETHLNNLKNSDLVIL